MAEYNPSKIIKDGNTYNFRDTTKIPLAGSNQISGSLIPATDNSIDIGSSTNNIKMLYTKGITIDGAQFLPSDYIPRSGGAVITGGSLSRNVNTGFLRIDGGYDWEQGSSIVLSGKDRTDSVGGGIALHASNGTQSYTMILRPDGTLKWGTKNVAMAEDVIPRNGGSIITGFELCRVSNEGEINLSGGSTLSNGGFVKLLGDNHDNVAMQGVVMLTAQKSGTGCSMVLYPNGTWTWSGTAVQLVSDQRLKQQITEIDDKLLDAWEDVELSQFKYNDAVDQKKDKARLHTGFVVQQIDEACKSHNVDISEYGLYCHEEYPQETEEVEVEQADGTKTKERKVIREASEHYSLRYTEALIVECAYLRKKLKELTARIEQLESSK